MNREDLYPTDEELAEWGVERAEAYDIQLSIDNAVKRIVEWLGAKNLAKGHPNCFLLALEDWEALKKLTEE